MSNFKTGDYVFATKTIRDLKSKILLDDGEHAVITHCFHGGNLLVRKSNNPAIEVVVKTSEIARLGKEEA